MVSPSWILLARLADFCGLPSMLISHFGAAGVGLPLICVILPLPLAGAKLLTQPDGDELVSACSSTVASVALTPVTDSDTEQTFRLAVRSFTISVRRLGTPDWKLLA